MQYKESDVITIMFSNGMELIGKLVNEDGGGVVVNRPMLCQATEKGVAFSPAITLTGEAVDENLSIKKTNIPNSYNEKMSSILTPESNIELVK